MKTIRCVKLKKHLPALEKSPYPGELGEKIHANVSQQAWKMWLDHQTRLINEKRLNLLDAQVRTMLKKEMENFLFETGEVTKVEGYVEEK